MKSKLFILALLLPIGSYAICFQTFQESGSGKTKKAAEADAIAKAQVGCGNDEFNWPQIRGTFNYKQVSHNEVIATANFQCCGVW